MPRKIVKKIVKSPPKNCEKFYQKYLEKLWKRNGFVFQGKPLWFDEKNLAKNDAKKRCEKLTYLAQFLRDI